MGELPLRKGGHLTRDSPPRGPFDGRQNVVQGLKTKDFVISGCVPSQAALLKQLHRRAVVLQRVIPMKVYLRHFKSDGKVWKQWIRDCHGFFSLTLQSPTGLAFERDFCLHTRTFDPTFSKTSNARGRMPAVRIDWYKLKQLHLSVRQLLLGMFLEKLPLLSNKSELWSYTIDVLTRERALPILTRLKWKCIVHAPL